MLRYHKTQTGFVLLAVLIFMQILILLSFFELMFAVMRVKQNRHQLYREEALWKAHQILKEIENNVVEGAILCKINVIDPAALTTKSINWWEGVSCGGNLAGIRYYYAIEFLGQDACAAISGSNHHQSILAEHYRITLFVLLHHLKGAKIFLQSTVIKAGSEISLCTGSIHTVHLGRQVLREI